MSYDPEAVYQDADIEMAQWELEGRRDAALRAQGVCLHNSAVGYRSPAVYPEQEGLEPGQLRCTDGCGQVFQSDEDWDDAREQARS